MNFKQRFLLLSWCLMSINLVVAQNINWTFSAKALGNDEYELSFKAKLGDGLHTYSQFIGEDGPVPTSVNYDSKHQQLVGKSTESTSKPEQRIEGMDAIFEMNLIKFKKDYTIKQKVKVKAADAAKPVVGYVTCMICDAEKCFPPSDYEFSISLPKAETPGQDDPTKTGGTANNTNPTPQPQPTDTTQNSTASVDTTTAQNPANNTVSAYDGAIYNPAIEKVQTTLAAVKSTGSCGEEVSSNERSLFTIFILGFLGGLFALLTPCVFPMVPLTVSYFTKRSKTRAEGIKNALIYGTSIIVIYVSLGLLVTAVAGGDALNWISTHWIPNTLFFILFVAFAISFFGYYDIKLPSSWSNKSDAAADRGGLLGIFFMAFTLSLVSFSCTGPIIGTLLVEAADGGRIAPAMGMLGFSTALALPFGLFSMFPGFLQSLPKSGGWMNTIKVILGFLEVALAFKFLSKADLTEHWGILKYETFMAINILCALGMALYLFGFIRFPHDDKGAKISIPRYGFAVGATALAVYLGMGFRVNDKTDTYATPWLMSGIAPPACYSYVYPCSCPAGIEQCFHDYYEGLAESRRTGKPMLVDFTGYGCENCRKMEDNIWIKDKVYKHLNENYILVSLYVDDREKLEKILETADGKKLRTVGSLWATFEQTNFNEISQPLYVPMAPDETVLNVPVGAYFDEDGYSDFLQCGLDRYAAMKK